MPVIGRVPISRCATDIGSNLTQQSCRQAKKVGEPNCTKFTEKLCRPVLPLQAFPYTVVGFFSQFVNRSQSQLEEKTACVSQRVLSCSTQAALLSGRRPEVTARHLSFRDRVGGRWYHCRSPKRMYSVSSPSTAQMFTKENGHC